MRYYAIVIPHRDPAYMYKSCLVDILNTSNWTNEKIDAEYLDSNGITQEEYGEIHPEYAEMRESKSSTEPFEPWAISLGDASEPIFTISKMADFQIVLEILSEDKFAAYLIPESELQDFKYSLDSHQGFRVNQLLEVALDKLTRE